MTLVSCVELDARTVMLTVREHWSARRWLRIWRTEAVKSYTLAIRVGRWLDGDRYVLKPDPRHMRLTELFASWCIEQKLDRATGLPESARLLDG
jgi:hypothetical protein